MRRKLLLRMRMIKAEKLYAASLFMTKYICSMLYAVVCDTM